MLIFNGVLFLSCVQAVLVSKQHKNTRGCFAELRCGGKVKVNDLFQSIEMICVLISLEKSENLSIAVQGLPGLRGPQGPTGTSFIQ